VETACDGRIEDTDRVMFLRNYLTHLQRAAAEGFPIKGLQQTIRDTPRRLQDAKAHPQAQRGLVS
jgi:hypothetical protein